MAMKDVKLVLDKAHKDDNFRKMLLENPDEALKDFTLSDKEKSKLGCISKNALF